MLMLGAGEDSVLIHANVHLDAMPPDILGRSES